MGTPAALSLALPHCFLLRLSATLIALWCRHRSDGLTKSMDERLFSEFSYVSEREIKKKKEDKNVIPPTFLESILESINEKLNDN
jgi:hypothetical protein